MSKYMQIYLTNLDIFLCVAISVFHARIGVVEYVLEILRFAYINTVHLFRDFSFTEDFVNDSKHGIFGKDPKIE